MAWPGWESIYQLAPTHARLYKHNFSTPESIRLGIAELQNLPFEIGPVRERARDVSHTNKRVTDI